MSTGETGPAHPSDPSSGGRPPSEEELRAAYEAEIKKIRVEQIVLEQVVTLVNLGMRRTGLAPGTEDERDLGQVRLAIEAIRVQLPLLEQASPEQIGPIRDALSQLQMAFVRLGGPAAGEAASASGASGAGQGAAAPGAAPGASPPPGPASGAGGAPPSGPPPAEPQPGGQGEEAGPAQRSGRLWIPGQ
jgi:hypothetical protein